LKKKIVLMAILLIVLISAIFSPCLIAEAQTADNQVTLSDPIKKHYGVFLAGPGKGLGKIWQETSYINSMNKWTDTLLNKGEGWQEDRMHLFGPDTNSTLLEWQINFLKTKLKPGDELHFYFAGHGASGAMWLADGEYFSGNLAMALSGFDENVTISVVLDTCEAHLAENDLKTITDKNGEKINRKGNLAFLATVDPIFKLSWALGPLGNLGTNDLITTFEFLVGHSPVYAKSLFPEASSKIYLSSYGDQDGDGRVDEDGGVLGDYVVENGVLGEDDDGDGNVDEDPPPQRGSYCADPPEGGGVGGIVIPVNKLALLAPYIGLASTTIIAAVVTAVYFKRVKRRKEKQ